MDLETFKNVDFCQFRQSDGSTCPCKSCSHFRGGVKSIAFSDQHSPSFFGSFARLSKSGFHQFRPFDDSLSCFRKSKLNSFLISIFFDTLSGFGRLLKMWILINLDLRRTLHTHRRVSFICSKI